MSVIRRFLFRFATVFRTQRAEHELQREVRSHLQLLEDKFVAQGMSAADAGLAARRAFGGQVEQIKERQRDERSFPVLDQSWLDIKLAVRMLVRYPGLTIVSVLGMSVAIAIAAGAFAAIQSLLYPTLPLDEGDRVVSLQSWDLARNDAERHILHDFVTWRDELALVKDLGAFRQVARNLIATGTHPEVVRVTEITASAFQTARVAPQLGRYLLENDERPGAAPVAVIGHGIWQTRFAGDPSIIGRALQLGAVVHTIVGVMPDRFAFPMSDSLWVPLSIDPTPFERLTGPEIYVFGRLAPRASIGAAQAELATVGQRASATFPQTHAQLRPSVLPYTYPFSDMDDPENSIGLHVMHFAVSLLLGIVCVNVAILVYARTATRQAEIALRSALGASRRRIVGQLFIEALALAVLAAGLGLVILKVTLDQVDRAVLQVTGQLPFWLTFDVSLGSVLYMFLLAVVAAAIVGVVPALKATNRHLQTGLKDMTAGGGSNMRLGRTWTALIVAQVAIAVALLPTTVYHAWEAATHGISDPGFPAEEILGARLVLDQSALEPTIDIASAQARLADRQAELVSRLAADRSVRGVTYALHPVGEEVSAWIDAEAVALPTISDDYNVSIGRTTGHRIRLNRIGVEWFDVFDVPLVAGRRFAGADTLESTTAILVNRAFVRDVLRGENAIGRRLRYVGVSREGEASAVALDRWFDIVGVVGDIPATSDLGFVPARVYHPLTPGKFSTLALAMRITGDPLSFSGRLREITAAVDPDLQLRSVSRMDDYLRREQPIFWVIAIALLLLTASVVVLAAAGIYSMMSCTVEQRRREIGIRAALGADPRRLLAAIFARALSQLTLGAGIGMVVGAFLERASEGDLLQGHGAVILPSVAVFMMTVGLVAAYGPARRGLAIQPTEALRAE